MSKITILGGSSVASPELVNALRRYPAPPQPIKLVLHGRTSDKLLPVAKVATMLAEGCDWLHVTATTDLHAALEGAIIIVNQVRVGGLMARHFDESFPIAFGIPGEETVGPGGFANAMRTVPVVVDLARVIEQVAPTATLLSFTNPASVIQYAVTRVCPNLNVIGLCDASITMKSWAASALGCDPTELAIDYVGMHHYGFITRVWRHSTNSIAVDVTAQVLANLERVSGLEIDVDLIRSLGALPTMYFKYFWHADRMLAKQQGKPTRAEQLQQLENDLLAEYAQATQTPSGLAKRSAKWYEAIIAPVVMALLSGSPHAFILNLRNNGLHTWLPDDAIIETPCQVKSGAITTLPVSMPSVELRGRIAYNCAYEQLMVEAFLERSETKAIRALAMNELVQNTRIARALWETIKSFNPW